VTETQYLGLCVDRNLHPLQLGTNEVMGEVVDIIHVPFEGHGYHHDYCFFLLQGLLVSSFSCLLIGCCYVRSAISINLFLPELNSFQNFDFKS
jgi:hypothetical protein